MLSVPPPLNPAQPSTEEAAAVTPKRSRTKQPAKTLYKQHDVTKAEVLGLGKEAAKLQGRLATEKLWDFVPSPKCVHCLLSYSGQCKARRPGSKRPRNASLH